MDSTNRPTATGSDSEVGKLQPDRREFLKSGAALIVGAVVAPVGAAAATAPAQRTLIQRENDKPGTRDWQLTRVRLDKNGGFRSPMIEGYCSKQSVLAGQTIDIRVSVRPATPFTIEIFRTGYYGGTGARLMTTLG